MGALIADELKTALAENRQNLARALVESAKLAPRFDDLITREGSVEDFADRELVCLIDYISGWVAGGDEAFRALYVGERAKMAYLAGDAAAMRNKRIQALIKKDSEILLRDLSGLSVDALEKLKGSLDDVARSFDVAFSKELKILLVGDCVHLDILAFLTGLAADAGIGLALSLIHI